MLPIANCRTPGAIRNGAVTVNPSGSRTESTVNLVKEILRDVEQHRSVSGRTFHVLDVVSVQVGRQIALLVDVISRALNSHGSSDAFSTGLSSSLPTSSVKLHVLHFLISVHTKILRAILPPRTQQRLASRVEITSQPVNTSN